MMMMMTDPLARRLLAALRDHLAGEPPRPPEGSLPLWQAFSDLCAARTWHASGPNPISYADLDAYCRLMRWPFEPRHVAIITAMDVAWLDHVRGKAGANGRSEAPRPSGDISPALFDSVIVKE